MIAALALALVCRLWLSLWTLDRVELCFQKLVQHVIGWVKAASLTK